MPRSAPGVGERRCNDRPERDLGDPGGGCQSPKGPRTNWVRSSTMTNSRRRGPPPFVRAQTRGSAKRLPAPRVALSRAQVSGSPPTPTKAATPRACCHSARPMIRSTRIREREATEDADAAARRRSKAARSSLLATSTLSEAPFITDTPCHEPDDAVTAMPPPCAAQITPQRSSRTQIGPIPEEACTARCDRDRRSPNAGITQLVECQLPKLNVAGSNPVSRFFLFFFFVLLSSQPPQLSFLGSLLRPTVVTGPTRVPRSLIIASRSLPLRGPAELCALAMLGLSASLER